MHIPDNYEMKEDKGVRMLLQKDSWYQIVFSEEYSEYIIIEVSALPNQEDLSMFHPTLDAAILETRHKNANHKRNHSFRQI